MDHSSFPDDDSDWVGDFQGTHKMESPTLNLTYTVTSDNFHQNTFDERKSHRTLSVTSKITSENFWEKTFHERTSSPNLTVTCKVTSDNFWANTFDNRTSHERRFGRKRNRLGQTVTSHSQPVATDEQETNWYVQFKHQKALVIRHTKTIERLNTKFEKLSRQVKVLTEIVNS